jgi:DNA-binding response OmpR family regulator
MSKAEWNGLEACWEIREFAPDTKIIMIVAPDADEDRVRAIEAGADDCVNHPLQLRELVARARAVLRLSSPKAAGQPAEGQPELPKIDAPRQSTGIESPRSIAERR